MQTDITLPRSVVAQLAEDTLAYMFTLNSGTAMYCGYCKMHVDARIEREHASSCPIRVLQEALKAAA